MGGQVINLFVIMAIGVMLADLVVHFQGTQVLLNGIGNLWAIGVNGMLGQPSAQR